MCCDFLNRSHLQYNLLVLYDPKYRSMYRRSSMPLSSASLDGEDAEVRAWWAQACWLR